MAKWVFWQLQGTVTAARRLMAHFLKRTDPARVEEPRRRIVCGIKTTLASDDVAEVSLAEALEPEAVGVYSKLSTDNKYLLNPSA